MHRYVQTKGLLAVVAVSVWLAGALFAQEKGGAEKPVDKPAAKSSKEAPPPKQNLAKPVGRRRLPRYYGKLGLSEAQREKIYGVQEKHAAEIEKLEKQLADLKEKQEADCRKVLTADQKKQLMEAVDTGKARSKGKDESDEMEG